MRDRRMRRAPFLAGPLFLTVAVVIAGCNSTAPFRDPDAAKPPAGKNSASNDIAWKKANDSIRTTSYQAQPDSMPPVPDLLLENDAKPGAVVPGQPVSLKHGKHHAPAPPPPPLPNAPNEWSPVILPTYVIRPPDVLLIELLPQFSRDENFKLKVAQIGLLNQPIYGQHLVRPDGTVELGVYGPVQIAGRTLPQAREEIARAIHSRLDPKKATVEDVVNNLKVDVLTYNSSVYYVITDLAGRGQQVNRFPVTGHETVLDAISNINGLGQDSCPKRIWVARKNPGGPEQYALLPVDWKAVTELGASNTNWQLMPGDRVIVQSDPMRRFNNNLAKYLEPIERVMGATLLGAQTHSTIRNGTTIGGR